MSANVCFNGILQIDVNTWWRYQMQIFPALLALCVGISALTKASEAALWDFLWYAFEQTVEETIETRVT